MNQIVKMPPRLGIEDRLAIEDFLKYESNLLDRRMFEEWRDLFAEDGRYWVPLTPEQASPDSEASLFYDDRKVMATRFERLRHPNIHAQTPPHRTCHLIGSIVVEHHDPAAGEFVVTSSLIMADYRLRVKRLFAAHVTHRLRRDKDTFRIVLKRVDLINCDDVFELIAVPF